jgi:hypothetical protein
MSMKSNGAPHDARAGRHRLVALALAAMLPIALFAAFAVKSVYDGHRAAEETRRREVGQALASAVDARLGSSFQALRILASSSPLDVATFDAADLEERARRIGADTGDWAVLLGPPPDYVTLANSRRSPGVRFPPLRTPEVAAAIETPLRAVFEQRRPALSNLFRGPIVGDLVLVAFMPVIRDGRVSHALAGGLEPSVFRTLLTEQGLRDGVFAFIVDGNNRIIAHSVEAGGPPAGTSVPAWLAAARERASESVVVGPGLLGTDNVYAFARLDLAPEWQVVLAQPVEMVNAAAWRSAGWLPLGGGALALGAGLAVWATRREAVRNAEAEADALRAGRAEVERLHAGLPAVIFLRRAWPDGSSRLVYRGGDTETVFGWPAEAIAEAQDFRRLIHPGDTTLPQTIPQLLRDGHVSYDWRMRQPSGGWRSIHTLMRVLSRRPEGGAEIVGYNVDVTSQRQAEERAMAAANLASLGEMAAGLAHEMKQPLQSISLAAEVAQIALVRGNCVFHVMVGVVCTASWARIPRDRGQGFHGIAGTRVRVPETGLPTI